MYRKIRSILREPRLAEDVKRLLTEGTGFDAADIDIALAVFEELRLISRYNFDGEEFYQFQMVNKRWICSHLRYTEGICAKERILWIKISKKTERR